MNHGAAYFPFMPLSITVQHYAHFNLESLLGTWKVYAAAVNPKGNQAMALPRRFVHTLLDEDGWRDGPDMNSFIIKVRLGKGWVALLAC